MTTDDSRDRIYAEPRDQINNFVFDDKVAAVFPDMLNRSIPGYSTIIRMIGLLAGRQVAENGCCYDLGCSLGAAGMAMAKSVAGRSGRVIAVDNSAAMIERARTLLEREQPRPPITFQCRDILDFPLENAAMVVLNFTMQFIAPEQRESLLRRIHRALIPGGLLVLSEKIAFEQSDIQQLFNDTYHQFKMDRGYSELEVSQKRAALEEVLIPETLDAHQQRLQHIGFSRCASWYQCFNFISLLAVK